MGNQCCHQPINNSPITDYNFNQRTEVAGQILKMRVQICSLPSFQQNIQQKIDKFAKKFSQQNTEIPETSKNGKLGAKKIWKIGRPYNFIYRNEQQDSNKIPKGLCTIYKLKQNSQDFAGFFQGYIDEKGNLKQKDCVIIYPNGSSYFIGKSQTEGIYRNQTNKISYEGGWQCEHPQGYGVEETTKGKYQGTFLNGKKSGEGKFSWNDGSILIGNFKNGNVDGIAEFTDKSAQYKYEGEFSHGFKQGQGKWRSLSGTTFYQGQFKNGKRHGQGILYLEGRTYTGMFQEDEPHGIGSIRDVEGRQTRGIWQRGQFKVFLDGERANKQ